MHGIWGSARAHFLYPFRGSCRRQEEAEGGESNAPKRKEVVKLDAKTRSEGSVPATPAGQPKGPKKNRPGKLPPMARVGNIGQTRWFAALGLEFRLRVLRPQRCFRVPKVLWEAIYLGGLVALAALGAIVGPG